MIPNCEPGFIVHCHDLCALIARSKNILDVGIDGLSFKKADFHRLQLVNRSLRLSGLAIACARVILVFIMSDAPRRPLSR